MNSKRNVILLVILIVLVLVGSYFLYQKLSANAEQNTSETTSDTSAEESTEAANDTSIQDTTAATSNTSAQTASDFTVYDADGNAVTLSSFFGKPTVVNCWASWCGPCQSELPGFQAAYEQHGDDVNFAMVNLTGGGNDTVEDAQAVLSEGGYTFPVYYDTDSSAALTYGIRSIPFTLFIAADGSIQFTQTGTMSEEDLTSQIEALLA